MYSNAGSTSISASTISGNTATSGGGGLYLSGGATISGATISSNSAVSGGGLMTDIQTVSISGSSFMSNTATGGGGGLASYGPTSITGTTFSGNKAVTNGGGLDNERGTAALTNVTLSGNSASTNGGGLYNVSTALLKNVTVSDNSALSGGALYMSSGFTTVLTNTILAFSHSGGNCSGTATSSKYSFSSDNTCALPGTIKGLSPNGLDPLLSALGNYGGPTLVHMLRVGSPALDGVVGNDAPLTDQRGLPRPQGGGYDIGAVERQPGETGLLPRLYLPLIVR